MQDSESSIFLKKKKEKKTFARVLFHKSANTIAWKRASWERRGRTIESRSIEPFPGLVSRRWQPREKRTAKKDSPDIGVFVSMGVSPADISRETVRQPRYNILRARLSSCFRGFRVCSLANRDRLVPLMDNWNGEARFAKSGRQAPKGKIKRDGSRSWRTMRLDRYREPLSLSLSLSELLSDDPVDATGPTSARDYLEEATTKRSLSLELRSPLVSSIFQRCPPFSARERRILWERKERWITAITLIPRLLARLFCDKTLT